MSMIDTLKPILHNQIPVITTELLARLYGTDVANIKMNFSRNVERFVLGKHFFKLEGEILREFKHRVALNYPVNDEVTESYSVKIARNVRALILWTERGAARHAKMLETDQAWEVFEKLEDCYFSQKEKPTNTKTTVEQRTPLRDAVSMLVSKKHISYPEAYTLIHQRFDVEGIDDLSSEQVTQAIEYVHRLVLEGEFIGKQAELPKPELDINYPLEWFAENSPYVRVNYWNRTMMQIDPSVLLESPSPSKRLFNQLQQHGFDVTAPTMEINALRHIMIEMRWALNEISRMAERKSSPTLSVRV